MDKECSYLQHLSAKERGHINHFGTAEKMASSNMKATKILECTIFLLCVTIHHENGKDKHEIPNKTQLMVSAPMLARRPKGPPEPCAAAPFPQPRLQLPSAQPAARRWNAVETDGTDRWDGTVGSSGVWAPSQHLTGITNMKATCGSKF